MNDYFPYFSPILLWIIYSHHKKYLKWKMSQEKVVNYLTVVANQIKFAESKLSSFIEKFINDFNKSDSCESILRLNDIFDFSQFNSLLKESHNIPFDHYSTSTEFISIINFISDLSTKKYDITSDTDINKLSELISDYLLKQNEPICDYMDKFSVITYRMYLKIYFPLLNFISYLTIPVILILIIYYIFPRLPYFIGRFFLDLF